MAVGVVGQPSDADTATFADVRLSILLIIALGTCMLFVAIFLYGLGDTVAAYERYLLPLPPISVAAYMYALNRMSLPQHGAGGIRAGLRDLVTETLVGVASFLLVTTLILRGLFTLPDEMQGGFMIMASMGAAILVVGIALYLGVQRIGPYYRYLKLLPPLSVASYIYVLNTMNADVFGDDVSLGRSVGDLLAQTAIGTLAFFSIAMLVLVGLAGLSRATGEHE